MLREEAKVMGKVKDVPSRLYLDMVALYFFWIEEEMKSSAPRGRQGDETRTGSSRFTITGRR